MSDEFVDPRRLTEAPAPPVSKKADPRFGSENRKRALAEAFLDQGDDYDSLRPGYPAQALDLFGRLAAGRPVVDLGAGTGKLAVALASQGCAVTAVDPSAAMLAVARRNATAEGVADRLTTLEATAESTGLPAGEAGLVTAAQAWHWFDAPAASKEVARLVTRSSGTGPLGAADGGAVALLWNTLDVVIPWVHRYARIAHAGDVHRDGFTPATGPEVTLESRHVFRWGDPRTTHEAIRLATTRSYFVTAPKHRQGKVLDNLDWYIHEHLGYKPGSTIELPYRTDVFVYRPTRPPST